MAFILPVNEIYPNIHESCFIAPNATVVGQVTMGAHGSIWFNAIVRGDVNSIHIGENVNIQDGACIHCTYQKTKTMIGDNVSIGHLAIVHGCTIHHNVLVGMGAIIMDNAIVNSNTIIAAGAVILENTICEGNSIYAGVPAKKVKTLPENTTHDEIKRIAENYKMYSKWFKA